MRHRVVVTGMGVVAPNGIGLEAFWCSLLAGESGIGPITLFDTSEFPLKIGGEIKDFDLHRFVNGTVKRERLGRHTQLALAATKLALRDSGVALDDLEHDAPVGLCVGVSSSAIEVVERGTLQIERRGPARVSPFLVIGSQPNSVASEIAEFLGVGVLSKTLSNACAAGLSAVAAATDMIQRGKTQLAIAGGTDSPINPFAIAAFGAMGLVPRHIENPRACCRPFDLYRQGGIPSEAACFLVLEAWEHASARGARPWAEILGYGEADDPPGDEPCGGIGSAIGKALTQARCRPQAVDYICAHAPGDPVIDRVETAQIRQLLGRHAYRIPVTSIKGCTGSPLSAAGPLQLATCALAFKHGLVPPTTNFQTRDPDCDLDYVPNSPRKARLNIAIVNVHGLGGSNASLVLKRV